MKPLVSCIMPTSRRPLALQPSAFDCWLRQTYANRELIIVAEGLPEQITSPNDRRIRYIQADPSLTTGEKRNLACEVARGEYIVNWDDDDWSSPERITEQVDALEAGGAAAGGALSLFFVDGDRAHLFRGPFNANIGTALIYTRAWWKHHPFPAKKAGEDADFVNEAVRRHQWKPQPFTAAVIARDHPLNTCRRDYANEAYQPVDWNTLPARFRADVATEDKSFKAGVR